MTVNLTAIILHTAWCKIQRINIWKKFIHLLFFLLYGRMDIKRHCNLHIAVPQDFTQTFDIEAHGNASRGERMAEHMEIKIVDAAFLQNPFKPVLQSADIDPFIFYS